MINRKSCKCLLIVIVSGSTSQASLASHTLFLVSPDNLDSMDSLYLQFNWLLKNYKTDNTSGPFCVYLFIERHLYGRFYIISDASNIIRHEKIKKENLYPRIDFPGVFLLARVSNLSQIMGVIRCGDGAW